MSLEFPPTSWNDRIAEKKKSFIKEKKPSPHKKRELCLKETLPTRAHIYTHAHIYPHTRTHLPTQALPFTHAPQTSPDNSLSLLQYFKINKYIN